MELLSYMCVTSLFYHRLMLHDASGAAPLRLVLVSAGQPWAGCCVAAAEQYVDPALQAVSHPYSSPAVWPQCSA